MRFLLRGFEGGNDLHVSGDEALAHGISQYDILAFQQANTYGVFELQNYVV